MGRTHFLKVVLFIMFAFNLTSTTWAGDTTKVQPALGVDQFMKSKNQPISPVWVEGVVSGVYPKQKMLGLIDTKEFKQCKVVTCAALTLPVRWNGPMPEVKTRILVKGMVKKEGESQFFLASDLKKIVPK